MMITVTGTRVPVRLVKKLWGRSLVVTTEESTVTTWVEDGSTWKKVVTVIPVGTNVLTGQVIE